MSTPNAEYGRRRGTLAEVCNGLVRLCEVEYWDGGEWVTCHVHARRRNGDGFWICDAHNDGSES